jgi:hypothetical protein
LIIIHAYLKHPEALGLAGNGFGNLEFINLCLILGPDGCIATDVYNIIKLV